MALPKTPASRWIRELERPFQSFAAFDDYQLYEEDDEFHLTVNVPGFDPDQISVTWDGGVLDVAAEHTDDRGYERTFHRQFRFPKEIDEDAVTASYTNGVLEVTLPLAEDASSPGTEIPIEC